MIIINKIKMKVQDEIHKKKNLQPKIKNYFKGISGLETSWGSEDPVKTV